MRMRNRFYIIFVILIIMAISGCVTVRKVVKDRVDQDIVGNQGYLQGDTEKVTREPRDPDREYIDIRFEVPTWGEVTAEEESAQEPKKAAPRQLQKGLPRQPAPRAVKPAGPVIYKVREGESLGSIAQKFYNRASKWSLIYEANMDKIKDPNRLRPGIEIVIPNIEEAESKYIK